MPPDRQDPQRRQGEQPDEHAPCRAEGAHHARTSPRRESPDQFLGGRPQAVVGGQEPHLHPAHHADRVRQQQHQPRAQGGGAQPRQGAQAIEGRQRPADPQKGDQHGPGADAVPQQPAQALAPVAGDVPGQQREPEKEASHQRPDPDELLPRLRRHATMRRSTKEGTTVKRSALALNATSSPRVTPRSSRAASEASSAAAQPA